MKSVLNASVVVANLVLPLGGCHRAPYRPARPANVSHDATYIQGPDGHGLWEACDVINGQDSCHIWTVAGNDLQQGPFVPYDGGSPIEKADLQIAQQGGSSVVLLKSGRYLIPASGNGHEAALRYLDFTTGKSNSFAGKNENH